MRVEVVQMKDNNNGFTLVELIIGVTILAIVVVPLLSMFSTSARTSARSAEMGEVTLLAENVAEQLEAMDLNAVFEEDAEMIPSVTYKDIAYSGGFLDESYENLTDIEEKKQANNAYYVDFENIEMQYGKYDVVVDFELGTYPTTDLPSGEGYGYVNSVSIPQYTSMDYVFNQGVSVPDPDGHAVEQFTTAYSLPQSLTIGDMEEANREIKIRVTDTNPDEEEQVKATIEMIYTFAYTSGGTRTEGSVTTGEIAITPEEGVVVEEGEEYPAFYVLFDPWYKGEGDKIVVTNKDNFPVDIILAKQQMSDVKLATMGVDNFNEAENSYKAMVTLEQARELAIPPATVAQERATIISNIAENLETGAEGNNVTYRVQIGSVFQLTTRLDEGKYLVVQDEAERLFATTIKIYERTGTAADYSQTPLYELETTNLQ